MQAKTTPLLFLQDFAFKSNAAVVKTVMSFALLLTMVFSGYAQIYPNGQSVLGATIVVPSTASNGEADYSPFPRNKKRSRMQFLYTKSELNPSLAAAGTPGKNKITKIALQLGLANGAPFTYDNVKVKLGYVSADGWGNKALMPASTDMLTMYYGALQIPVLAAGEWLEIEFNPGNSFDYNPDSGNLVVEFESSTILNSPGILFKSQRITSTSNYMSRGCYSNTLSDIAQDMFTSPSESGPSVSKISGFHTRPNITLTFEANALNVASRKIAIISGQDLCSPEPVKLEITNVYGSRVSLKWMEKKEGDADYVEISGSAIDSLRTYTTTQDPIKREYKCFLDVPDDDGFYGGVNSLVFPGANTYSGTTWSKGTPTAGQALYFKTSKSISQDMSICRLFVDSGVTVSVTDASSVEVQNKFRTADVKGALVFEDRTTLFQNTSEFNENINFTYIRNTTPLNRYDYTYYSSPVKGATLGSVSPHTLWDKFFLYDASNPLGWVQQDSSAVMKEGIGYIIRAPQTYAISGTPLVFPAKFKGIPNNGNIPFNLTASNGEFNLIGNPYPSAVDTRLFLQDYSSKLDGTIYLWQHTSGPSSTPDANGIYQYLDNNYRTVNASGSTDGEANYTVASGQSFMVKTIADNFTNAIWKNSHRVPVQDTVTFFKTQNVKLEYEAAAKPQGRIWLEINGQQGKYQRMLVAYVNGATEGYDNGYDAEHMQASNLGFYAIAADQQELGIMAKGLPFNFEELIKIGFSTTSAGPMTITKFKQDGFFKDYVVFINDKLTNTLHDLSASSYTFNSAAGTFNNRFVLSFKPKTVQIINPTIKPLTVVVYDKSEALQLHSNEQKIKDVVVYDMNGRILAKVSNCDSIQVAMSTIPRTNQLIVVEITLVNGMKETQKFQF